MSDGSLTKIMGWDGSAWQKLGLLFGYYDDYLERISKTATAGNNTVSSTVVPANEIRIINSIVARNANTNVLEVFSIHDGSTGFNVYRKTQNSLSDGVAVATCSNLVIKSGNRFDVTFVSCTAGDSLSVFITGYKMKIS